MTNNTKRSFLIGGIFGVCMGLFFGLQMGLVPGLLATVFSGALTIALMLLFFKYNN